jgi:hypothetical protein
MSCCIACSVALERPNNEIAAVAVLAYGWRSKKTVEEICRDLCERHEAMFKRGYVAAEKVK